MPELNQKRDGGFLRRSDLIESLMNSSISGVRAALRDDPNCVNDVHFGSGMNAAMLASQSRMPTFLDEILSYAEFMDFGLRDNGGRDLLEVGMASADPKIVERVVEVYAEHAKHIVNNWPEP